MRYELKEMSSEGEDGSVDAKARELGLKLKPLSEAQEELNEKLLSGWSMLNDLCPISRYPLVKNPNTGEVWSIRCQMHVKAGDPSTTSPVSPSTNKENEMAQQTAGASAVTSVDMQSKYLSEKLLKGWRMLEETCPITHSCPLMLDPATNRKWSAAINDYIDEEPARVTQEAAAPAKSGCRMIKCTNLPTQVDVENLSDFFRPCGEVKNVQLRPDKSGEGRANYALIEFNSAEAARRAASLSGSLVDEHVISIEIYEEEESTGKETKGSVGSREAAKPKEKRLAEKLSADSKVSGLRLDPEGRAWSSVAEDFGRDDGDRGDDYEREQGFAASKVVPEEEVASVRSSLVADSMRTELSGVTAENRVLQEVDRCSEALIAKMAECRTALTELRVDSRSYGDELARTKQLIDIIAACGTTLRQLDMAPGGFKP